MMGELGDLGDEICSYLRMFTTERGTKAIENVERERARKIIKKKKKKKITQKSVYRANVAPGPLNAETGTALDTYCSWGGGRGRGVRRSLCGRKVKRVVLVTYQSCEKQYGEFSWDVKPHYVS